jgi:hypothetical protein
MNALCAALVERGKEDAIFCGFADTRLKLKDWRPAVELELLWSTVWRRADGG